MKWDAPVSGVAWPTERCIELPLAREFLQLSQPGRVLDAGCGMNLGMPLIRADLTHFTQNLASEHRYADPHRCYVAGDLRDLSRYPDRWFDRVVCLSTLEHVGCDNSAYLAPVEHDPNSAVRAAQELWRVTGSRFLLTVPFHAEAYSSPKWRYFSPETLKMITPTDAQTCVLRYYHRTIEGWEGGVADPYPWDGTSLARPSQIVCLKAVRNERS